MHLQAGVRDCTAGMKPLLSPNMTEGPVGSKLLRFAIPLALTGILQQLFNAADLIVVGRYAGSEALAAVGSNGPLVNMIVMLFTGISVGANVVISQASGRQDRKAVCRAIRISVQVALAGGTFIALFGQLMAAPLLRLMQVPQELMGLTVLYLRIYMAGAPVIFLYNVESAIFRGQGDSRTPLYILLLTGLLNVGLNLAFVHCFHMSVNGVALATVLSNAVAAGVLLAMLGRDGLPVRVEPEELSIETDCLKQVLSIGVPSGVQGMLFPLGNICIQSGVNSLGAVVMAGTSAALNLSAMVYQIVSAYGQTVTTFTGQNYGAGRTDRCSRVLKLGLAQGMAVTLAVSLGVICFARQALGLFTSDPDVIEVGYLRVVMLLAFQVVNCVQETFSGSMRGFGQSLQPAAVALLCVCAFRVVWVFTVFAKWHTFRILMAAYPLSFFLSGFTILVVYRNFRKKPGHGL